MEAKGEGDSMIRRKWKSVINNDRDRDRDTSRAKDHKINDFEEGNINTKKKEISE